jgi:leucyl aminopeptidase (aminopeptidase T)
MELAIGTETRREYLSFELARAARKVVEEIMYVKPGENVVILGDTGSDSRLMEATAKAAYAAGAHPIVIQHEALWAINKEPPPPVAAALAAADVFIEYSAFPIVYTEARQKAIDAGCRHFCLGGMGVDGLMRTIGEVNYPLMEKLEQKIEELVKSATVLHITSPAGTDFTVKIDKNDPPYMNNVIEPGRGYSRMLGGSGGFAALPDSANGSIVFDGAIYPPAALGTLKAPVTLQVKAGVIVAVEGGEEAKIYEKWLASCNHEMMYHIAHYCFGCNPGARLTGRMVEDERVFGCMNIGIGPTRLGAPAHSDGIFLNASVWADDVQLEDEGTYVHPDLVEICREMGVAGY